MNAEVILSKVSEMSKPSVNEAELKCLTHHIRHLEALLSGMLREITEKGIVIHVPQPQFKKAV